MSLDESTGTFRAGLDGESAPSYSPYGSRGKGELAGPHRQDDQGNRRDNKDGEPDDDLVPRGVWSARVRSGPSALGDGVPVWVGTGTFNTYPNTVCTNWTSTATSMDGLYGDAEYGDFHGLGYLLGNCAFAEHLYCFEQ